MVVGRKNAAVNVTPTDLTTYQPGADLGNGNIVYNNTTEAFAGIQNLQPGSTYHFAVFEFNGFNQPLYLSPAAVFSVTTAFALPVKLSKWEAIQVEGKVKLQWTTSSELNAGYFIIERGTDGIHFTSIATVQANGNSQLEITYSKDDLSPLSGKSYYRLKMVDIDGKSEYSPVRSVLSGTKQSAILMRNPVSDKLELVTSTTVNSNRNEWQIINSRGQIIKKGIVSEGRTEINVSALPTGTYWLRLTLDNQLQSIAFLKQ